jgi:hypothetical protein
MLVRLQSILPEILRVILNLSSRTHVQYSQTDHDDCLQILNNIQDFRPKSFAGK